MDYLNTFRLYEDEAAAFERLERLLPAARYLVGNSCLNSTPSASGTILEVAKLIMHACDSGELRERIQELRTETYRGLDKVTAALGGA